MEKLLAEQISQLCLESRYSDVTFVIKGEKLPGHRLILASRSEYFRALLYGGLSESTKTEITLDVPLEGFKATLKYVYCADLPLASMEIELLFEILSLAHEYGIVEFENLISDNLVQKICVDNAFDVVDTAHQLKFETILNKALLFIDRYSGELSMHESFNSLTKESLELVVSRDSFYADETKIFEGVLKWCQHNPKVDPNFIYLIVRLPLIDRKTLVTTVYASKIVLLEKIVDAIAVQELNETLPHRAALWPEENVALECHGASTIKGNRPETLLNGDWTSYKTQGILTYHEIVPSKPDDHCIMVELGRIHKLNYIQVLLYDKDNRECSYYIEFSIDGKKWERVVDNSNARCRAMQHLYFKESSAKFIKLVGTHSTIVGSYFSVVGLEAKYTKEEQDNSNA